MRLPLTALLLFPFLILSACGEEDDGGGQSFNRTPQPNDNFIAIEASLVDATADPMAPTWFSGTYLPQLATAPGVVQTRHYTNLGGPPPFPYPGGPTELSFFHFADAASRNGFSTSAPAMMAPTSAAVTQLSRAYYNLTVSADNGNAAGNLPNLTVIGLVIDPTVEAQVIDWEDNTHVPMLMGYQGVGKIVRYTKIAGGTNDAELPKFLEFFYYYSQADSDAWSEAPEFIAAEEDRAATWTDAQLAINPIVKGVLGYAMP
jgi:hypothetical protein